MPREHSSHPHETSGPGAGHVPRSGIIAFAVLATALALVVLYTIWAFWPTEVQEASGSAQPAISARQRVAWFGWHPVVGRELLFFLTIALSGALGGLIHTIRSFTWYVGNRDLRWSWIPYNVVLPLVGSMAGTVFYLVLRAGLFSPSTSVRQASPFGFAAVAVLAGLFSPQAFEKLKTIATDIFAKSPEGQDHVGPANASEPGDGSGASR
jgi:hypothetical protein